MTPSGLHKSCPSGRGHAAHVRVFVITKFSEILFARLPVQRVPKNRGPLEECIGPAFQTMQLAKPFLKQSNNTAKTTIVLYGDNTLCKCLRL